MVQTRSTSKNSTTPISYKEWFNQVAREQREAKGKTPRPAKKRKISEDPKKKYSDEEKNPTNRRHAKKIGKPVLTPAFDIQYGRSTAVHSRMTELECFDLTFTEEMYDHWRDKTTQGKNRLSGFDFDIRCQQAYLGMHLFFMAEQTSNVFEYMTEKQGILPDSFMGYQKYTKINSATRINPSQFISMANNTYAKVWDVNGNFATIDEVIAPCHLNHPVVQYVENKPHDTGIWTSVLSEFTQVGRPYTLKIIMRTLDRLQLSTADIVDQFLTVYKDKEVHITADNWYNNSQTRPLFEKYGVLYTMCTKSDDTSYSWSYLHSRLEKADDWIVFENTNSTTGELMMSCLFETKFKNVISNFFSVDKRSGGTVNQIGRLYYDHFNAVDLVNRTFYDIWYPHRHMNIDAVYFDTVLTISVLNSWVLFLHAVNKPVTLKEFTKCLSMQLLKKAGFSRKSRKFKK